MNKKINTKKLKDNEEVEELELPLIERIENYLNENYMFRYNEVTGRVEFTEKEQHCFAPITDYQMNSISREMSKAGFYCPITNLRNLLNSAFSPIYNPFKYYFSKLEAWDTETDYIQELAATITTTNDDFWNVCFKKWIVAAVACVLHEHETNHTVIVLSGTQGLGKTSWLQNLLPKELKDYCYSGNINPNNKDALINLCEAMFINMDELETLNRRDLNSLKEIITKTNIRIRRPYGFNTDNLPRRASFMGSVNSKEFLSDTTGNRRFLAFEATDINYKHQLPLDKIYAQALHLYNTGFKFWFDKEEIGIINSNNEQFRTVTPEEEMLLTHFRPCTEEDKESMFMTPTEISHWLVQATNGLNIAPSAFKLGKALTLHKFVRVKKKKVYGYYIKYSRSEGNELVAAA